MIPPQTLLMIGRVTQIMNATMPGIAALVIASKVSPSLDIAADAINKISDNTAPLPVKILRVIGFAPFRMVGGAIKGAINKGDVPAGREGLVIQITKMQTDYLILPGPEFIPYVQMVGIKIVTVVITSLITYVIVSFVTKVFVHYVQLRIDAEIGRLNLESSKRDESISFNY